MHSVKAIVTEDGGPRESEVEMPMTGTPVSEETAERIAEKLNRFVGVDAEVVELDVSDLDFSDIESDTDKPPKLPNRRHGASSDDAPRPPQGVWE